MTNGQVHLKGVSTLVAQLDALLEEIRAAKVAEASQSPVQGGEDRLEAKPKGIMEETSVSSVRPRERSQVGVPAYQGYNWNPTFNEIFAASYLFGDMPRVNRLGSEHEQADRLLSYYERSMETLHAELAHRDETRGDNIGWERDYYDLREANDRQVERERSDREIAERSAADDRYMANLMAERYASDLAYERRAADDRYYRDRR